MGEIWLIGWRNLSRRRSRTVLTAAMVGLGTALIVWVVGLSEGTYNDMMRLATRTYTGHVNVVQGDYHDKPSLYKTVADPDAVEAALQRDPRVAAVSRRVEAAGLLSAGEKTIGAMLVGVQPEKEKAVTTIAGAVDEGRWLPAAAGDAMPIVLGRGAADQLRATLGSEVSFISQAADGSIAAELFTVTGIFDMGGGYDSALAFIRLQDAQEMMMLQGRVHRVVGITGRITQADGVQRDTPVSEGNQLLTWKELMPELKRSIETDRTGGWVFNFVLVFMVVLGVGNTVMMGVLERTRELGVQLALGTAPRLVVAQTLAEAVCMSALGVAGGVALGSALNWYFMVHGLVFPGLEEYSFGGVQIGAMHAANTVLGNVIFPLVVLAGCALAAVVPARRAARLDPVKAIREG